MWDGNIVTQFQKDILAKVKKTDDWYITYIVDCGDYYDVMFRSTIEVQNIVVVSVNAEWDGTVHKVIDVVKSTTTDPSGEVIYDIDRMQNASFDEVSKNISF